MRGDQLAYVKNVLLAHVPASVPERNHWTAVCTGFCWNVRGTPCFFTSPRLPAATWAPHAHARRRRRPAATAPHRLPVACSRRSLPATTGNDLLTAASATAKTPGRRTSADGWRFRRGCERRTHSRKTDLRRVCPDRAEPASRCPCVRPPARSPPARASAA